MINRAILIGNLTKDVEMATTNSGKNVARFTIAVSRRYANADGEREADFLNIVVWNTLAENCAKYLQKGSKVAVTGAIQTRSYESEEGKRYITEIIADEVEFVGAKKEQDNQAEAEPKMEPINDDNLPF
jgi:single-strand DNA-binding protein